MSRRSGHKVGVLTAVSNSYVAATNSLDLGADAAEYRLRVQAKTSTAEGVWGYLIASKVALSDVDAAAALADADQRIRFYIGDESVTGVLPFEHTFNFPFRFLYFLTSAGAADLSVIAEKE